MSIYGLGNTYKTHTTLHHQFEAVKCTSISQQGTDNQLFSHEKGKLTESYEQFQSTVIIKN